MNDMFEGFELLFVDTPEAQIQTRVGGNGPPLLLLHGHPQTHAMWHAVAVHLAENFTVVATDLRGYGESSKPPTTPDHEPYSKRAMARDQVAVMETLGFERFFIAGHDRGARVGYRMALDHPRRVARLAVLDIIPTLEAFEAVDMDFAMRFWGWFFLAQPYPLPERLIGADPEFFFLHRNRSEPTSSRPPYFTEQALAEYLRCYGNPATIHAACEDYRAGATIDLEHDREDRARQRKIQCPVLALWSGRGELQEWYDVLGVWSRWAENVSGFPIDCGHFIAEEAPGDTLDAFRNFFGKPL